jgi:DNA-binding SARP family transcriptional activator
MVTGENGDERVLAAVRQRVLLAALLLRANQPVPSDELADAVWDGAPPPGYATTLRSYVMRLRQALGREIAPRLVTRQPGYLIQVDESELDVLSFETLYHRSGLALRAGMWAGVSDTATRALALWRGTPLVDVPSEVLHAGWLPRLEQLRVQVDEWRIEAELQLGHHRQLVPTLRDLAARYPLRENVHAALMRALAGSGQRAQALQVYQRARRVLVDELGIEPGTELRTLQQRILGGDDGGARAAPAAMAPRTSAAPRQLPAAVRHFAGRGVELGALFALLDESGPDPSTVAISVISGSAGIGKTTLSVYWAHQVADRFPDGQLYVNLHGFDPAGTPTSPRKAIRDFLDALDVSPQRIPTTLDAQIALYRSLLAGKRMLVMLDNARDAEQVRPLLPGTPGCLVIVTSRNKLSSLVAVEAAHSVNLDLLTADEAKDLLAQRLGRHRTAAEPDATDMIISYCARLPLALAIAAARAATHPQSPLAAIAADLADARTSLNALSAGDAAADVRAVFSWSYRTLTPAAARLFRLLGLHPGPDLTAAAAARLAAVPLAQVRPVLAELTGANLLVEQPLGRYAMHDLLRAYATELAQCTDTDEQRHAAVHRLLDHYLHSGYSAARILDPHRDPITLTPPRAGVDAERPADREQAMTWFTAERAVMLAGVDRAVAAGFDTHAWQLAWALATFLDWRGYWHDNVATQYVGTLAADRVADHVAQSCAHRLLGSAYTKLGRLDDAAVQLQRARELSIAASDPIGQAHAYHHLAYAAERRGRFPDALHHAQQALDLYRAACHRRGQAYTLNTVGWYHALLGDHQQAVTSCRQALTLHQELGNTVGQADTWDSLGFAHHHLGHPDEAIDCYLHSIDLFRQLGGRLGEAGTLANLGDAYHSAGHPDAAREAWHRAFAILNDLHHPDTARVRAKLDSSSGRAPQGL